MEIKPFHYPPLPEGKTFWDEEQYMATVKRLENGKRSLNDFLHMISERNAIEHQYAEKLRAWTTKWVQTVQAGPEYGELEMVWLTILGEGDTVSAMHSKMSCELSSEHREGIRRPVHKFRKSTYHKIPIINELKEVKESREAFKSAQNIYRKALESINRAKKRYFDSAKTCLTAVKQIDSQKNLLKAHSKPGGQKHKLEALQDQKERHKAQYIESLNYLNENVKDEYITSMTREFQKCQDIESERIRVLLNALHEFARTVNIQSHGQQPLTSLFNQVEASIINSNPEKNLELWANSFGTGMPTNFPEFQDADSDAVKAELAKDASEGNQVLRKGSFIMSNIKAQTTKLALITRLKKLKSDTVLRRELPSSTKEFLLRRPSNADISSCKSEDQKPRANKSLSNAYRLGGFSSQITATDLAYESTDMGIASKEHYKMTNVYVRVTTDFNATHKRELTIHKGELVYQLQGDDNGWCYGRIAHKEGSYPSKAVTLMKTNMFGV